MPMSFIDCHFSVNYLDNLTKVKNNVNNIKIRQLSFLSLIIFWKLIYNLIYGICRMINSYLGQPCTENGFRNKPKKNFNLQCINVEIILIRDSFIFTNSTKFNSDNENVFAMFYKSTFFPFVIKLSRNRSFRLSLNSTSRLWIIFYWTSDNALQNLAKRKVAASSLFLFETTFYVFGSLRKRALDKEILF